MTMNVQVKLATSSLLILFVLTGCSVWDAWFGREEVNLGEYVTLQSEIPETEQPVRWIFSQLPDSSKLLGFLPSDTVSQVSFKPDVPGEYDVVLQVGLGEDVSEETYHYEVIVAEDNTLVNQEVPEHIKEILSRDDTTVADTPAIATFTDDGMQRSYLAKVVSPNQPKKKASMPASPRVSKPKVVNPPQRGNLIPQADKTYTIQLSSWPSLDDAQLAAKELMDNYGIDTYVQRAFFKDKDEVYYRLRVGSFKNFSDAEAYAKEIQGLTSLPAWVDFVRQEM